MVVGSLFFLGEAFVPIPVSAGPIAGHTALDTALAGTLHMTDQNQVSMLG